MAWNPAVIRDRQNLQLTDAERRAILKIFDPLPPDQLRADGVFEGGGVLGIAWSWKRHLAARGFPTP
jgi:hypothetical protein